MTKEEYIANAEDVTYLASCMVRGEKPDAERVAKMDLKQLYKTSNTHLLTGIVGYALEEADVHDPEFVQAKSKAIRKIVLFDVERAAILAELEKAGIWHMPLKGCLLKEYYPKIGMRQMSDNDIYYDATRSGEVRRIMEGLGFTTVKYVHINYGHDCYEKQPIFNFEMHRAMASPSMDETLDKICNYYQGVREKMIKDEGCEYRYHLSPEDFYIYMIAHEYKHYSGGGTGLRSLLDTYVYLRKAHLDMPYVLNEVEKIGLSEFEAANRSLSFHLFDGEPLTEDEEEMLAYMLSSGTYGTRKNQVEKQLAQKGRLGYFLSRLTLPYKTMKNVYPILNKIPILYPIFWVYRLIYGFAFNRKTFMYQLKAALTGKT